MADDDNNNIVQGGVPYEVGMQAEKLKDGPVWKKVRADYDRNPLFLMMKATDAIVATSKKEAGYRKRKSPSSDKDSEEAQVGDNDADTPAAATVVTIAASPATTGTPRTPSPTRSGGVPRTPAFDVADGKKDMVKWINEIQASYTNCYDMIANKFTRCQCLHKVFADDLWADF